MDHLLKTLRQVEKLGYTISKETGELYNKHGDKIGHVHTNGYKVVVIKRKRVYVHRLIATLFLLNPKDKPCVNHIDGDKLNNKPDNLEWCTHAENQQHAYDNGFKHGYWAGKYNEDHSQSKPIERIDPLGSIVDYPSGAEACRQMKMSHGNLSMCLSGKRKTAYGYKWRFKSGTD